jgi:hypothetical protein
MLRLTTYQLCRTERQENRGPEATPNPLGHLGLLGDDLYLYLYFIVYRNALVGMLDSVN